ncbi:radical SAM/SPASM domain-containing protein [Streptomyces albireticuli]|uniref:Radical SAM protein n=1 Tax=Streptomyces albireticuli TaxID=1940 RepID=A0A2A2D353_9ACTN|nr:radical SAM protein [Streptomyces albireticuli]MCD9165766.1 radical SAM protein [Streptomyces albireticuli]MCD9195984.1 radical SAM protein [Streptomyces albireticuli]PAU46918.1 radical SAM protein [Streptomyces albireticuli]
MATALPVEQTTTGFLWLDLTRKCQLECVQCYNSSGPDGDHGTMTRDDWFKVLDQAAELGVWHITLIGGEPTMHPHAIEIASRALTLGIKVEVYSNLVHVPATWWDLLQREGMSLATSYYSDNASEHNEVTRRPSHARTRANIIKALELGIPVRAGIVGDNEQRMEAAKADLQSIGVSRIGTDHIREFGRACGSQNPDATNLCGGCGDGRASIDPTGEVPPCVFSTWMGVGNVREDSLTSILSGPALSEAVDSLRADWGKKDKDNDQGQKQPCNPDCVPKNPCDPRCEPNDACRPGTPRSECGPKN